MARIMRRRTKRRRIGIMKRRGRKMHKL